MFQFGDFYRLAGGAAGDENLVSWMSLSKDKKRAVVLVVQVLAKPNPGFHRILLRGLDPTWQYQVKVRPALPVPDEAAIQYNEGLRRGDELLYAGLLLGGDGWNGCSRGDFASWLFTLEV